MPFWELLTIKKVQERVFEAALVVVLNIDDFLFLG